MKKPIVAIVIAVVAIGAALIWWQTGRSGDSSEIVLYGNVDIRQVSLAFEGSGRVEALKVDEGDTVKAGDLLAVLDTRTMSLELERAKAEAAAQQQNALRMRRGSRPEEIRQAEERVTAARADASRTASDLARLREVSRSTNGQGVSGHELDTARAAAEAARAKAQEAGEALSLARQGPRSEDIAAAQAQLKGALAQVAVLEHRIAQGELRAPSDAVVRSRLLEVGDMASPQQSVYELALTHPKWVRVYVSETDLGRIKPGMKAQVTTDAAPDAPVAGTVGYISSVAEFTPKSVETEGLRTSLVYEVRVRVEDSADRLRLGQPVTVTIVPGAPAK